MKSKIPPIISQTIKVLQDAGFEAFLVGGCVRDLMLPARNASASVAGGHTKPKDWDITTNAKPEQIQELFHKTIYENKFGTVGVITDVSDLSAEASAEADETLKIIEITPFRLESKYSDKRHPDSVRFTNNLEEDLKRRDFTINAMALALKPTYDVGSEIDIVSRLVDLFHGKQDLEDKIIRAVGNPEERFEEDALRVLRAIRFATELGFSVIHETQEAIKKKAHLLEMIAKERIRDEFEKIVMSDNAMRGVQMMHDLGVLKYVVPELEEGIGIEQNKDHKFTVWEHNLRALDHAVSKKWPFFVRLAALLHDVAKPVTRQWNETNKDWTFYGHDVVGGKMSVKILSRLKFSKKDIELIAKLVRYHLFFSDTDKITLSAVRRTVRNVGVENIWDLMKVRFSDRVGMGVPKESPYRLRKYESMIEEAMRAPLSVGMLKIDGNRIMELLDMKPGPKIGFILHALLEEVLDEPSKNTEEWLENKAKELSALSEKELEELGRKAKETKEEIEKREIEVIRKKWFVK